MSPMLFALYIEDLELFLRNEPECGLSIDDSTFILMLFADDMVIFGSTPQDLQNSLDMLKRYCDNGVWLLIQVKQKYCFLENGVTPDKMRTGLMEQITLRL